MDRVSPFGWRAGSRAVVAVIATESVGDVLRDADRDAEHRDRAEEQNQGLREGHRITA